MNQLVSIIMPVYNSFSFLEKSVQSVLTQTHLNWELILVDDCSTDDSYSLMRQLESRDTRINAYRLQVNSGAAVARNHAIGMAKGRYIAFLDSDDEWTPDKLVKQIVFMEEGGYAFSFTSYQIVNEQGVVVNRVRAPSKVKYSDLLKGNPIGCLAAMYDTAYFGRVEMPLVRKRQDLGLWLSLLKRCEYGYGMHEELGSYTIRPGSISNSKLKVISYTWFLYREIEEIPLYRALYYFGHYAFKGVIKTYFKRSGG